MDPRAAFRCGAQARIIWKVPSTLTPRIFWNTAASSASQFAEPVTVAALRLPEIDSDPIYPPHLSIYLRMARGDARDCDDLRCFGQGIKFYFYIKYPSPVLDLLSV